jgi:hypothetical protein
VPAPNSVWTSSRIREEPRVSLFCCGSLRRLLLSHRSAELFLHRLHHLIRWHLAFEGGEVPIVAERIGHAAHAITPKHVGRRHALLHSRRDRLLVRGVNVLHVDVEARVRAFRRLWLAGVVTEKKFRAADLKARMHDRLCAGRENAVKFFRSQAFSTSTKSSPGLICPSTSIKSLSEVKFSSNR